MKNITQPIHHDPQHKHGNLRHSLAFVQQHPVEVRYFFYKTWTCIHLHNYQITKQSPTAPHWK